MIVFITLFITTFFFSLLSLRVKKQNAIWLNFLLSFSGAFLLGITLMHVIPELYENHNTSLSIGIFVMIGFFIQVLLESYSKGIEHGHIHVHDFGKMPYGLFIALSLHALLEGSVLDITDFNKSVDVMFGILVHKIPVAFLLGYLLFTINDKKWTSFILLFIFALATPLGSFITSKLDFMVFGIEIKSVLMAMATGSFLHVATTILFETSPEHKLKINKFIPALLGGVLAVGASILNHHH